MKLEKQLLLNTKQSANERCYTSEALQSIADQINKLGDHSLGRNDYGGVALGLHQISFAVSNPVIENDALYIDVDILETPGGKKLESIINSVVFRPMSMIASNEDTKVIGANLSYLYTAAVDKSTDALNLAE